MARIEFTEIDESLVDFKAPMYNLDTDDDIKVLRDRTCVIIRSGEMEYDGFEIALTPDAALRLALILANKAEDAIRYSERGN